jgi:TonB-linked SusC/RagA family outer membrane protein
MKAVLLIVVLWGLCATTLVAREELITGLVTSAADGAPLPGVNVAIKGTTLGTNTDAQGRYTLAVPSPPQVLVFSFIGFRTREIEVGNRARIDVALEQDVNVLSEVVVIGYGRQDRRTLTGAVSSISSESIANLPAPSPDQLIQGRAAGVQVAAHSGEPGGGILVRVRGATSINASSDPLYVVDGVPVTTGNLAQINAGSSTTNALADLNPADIQSVEILKDASAAAIYGARAANGVVLITTKRGADQKPVISLDAYYGATRAWRDPDQLRVDGPTFERLQNEAARNNWTDQYGSLDAPDPRGNAFVLPYPDPDNATDTNWLDEIFRQQAPIRNIDLSVRGGSPKIRYFASGSRFAQEGLIKPTAFGRTSGRLNLDFNATDRLKIGTSLTYAATRRNRATNGNDITGALTTAFFYPSNIPVYNADGSYNKPIWENPVAAVNETDYRMTTDRLIGNVYAEYEIRPGLSLRTSWGLDHGLADEYRYFNTRLNAGAAVNGLANGVITRDQTWLNENTLSYRWAAGPFHSFSALLGNTVQENARSVARTGGQQFPNDAFRQLASASVKTDASSTLTQYGLTSWFTRLQYDYREKYLLTVNVRADASSRFGAGHRWAVFPSVAGGWRISEEPFMKAISRISNLKLRASYGVTGNQNGIDNFQSLGLWGGQSGGLRGGGGTVPINVVGNPAGYVDAPGFVPNQLANPDLKWETTTQLDVGLELGLFADRLTATFDYYDKQTNDLLLAVPVPRSLGYNSLVQNYGRMENKGFEIGVAAQPLRGGLRWNLSFNVARNVNKIRKLAAPFTQFTRDFIRLEEGVPLFSFWVHEQLGVDPQTGDAIWNTGADDVFDPNTDRFIAGNAQPDFFGGFTNDLAYKNFDLSAFFQFTYGNEILNYNRFFYEHGGERTTGYMATQLNRWQQPGDRTDVPRLASRNYSTALRPSRLIEDGSFLRLKNVSLGYTLPKSLTGSLGLSRLRVYVAGQNLLTFTRYSGLDPEVSTDASELIGGIDFATMPQPRVLMGGINIGF